MLDLETRLRVTADLCCGCVRNAAYYLSGWSSPKQFKKKQSDFWVNLNGNFLDITVLTWCFLFGDERAEFRWQEIIPEHNEFLSEMHRYSKCTEEEFNEYISSMRRYRDKCVAHRDIYLVGDQKITYPELELAIKSATFLYSELVRIYAEMEEIYAYKDLETFYLERLEMGLGEYAEASKK